MYCEDYKLLKNSLREMADRMAEAKKTVDDKVLDARRAAPIIVYPPAEN